MNLDLLLGFSIQSLVDSLSVMTNSCCSLSLGLRDITKKAHLKKSSPRLSDNEKSLVGKVLEESALGAAKDC